MSGRNGEADAHLARFLFLLLLFGVGNGQEISCAENQSRC
jgi:hypothetical protein